MSTSNGKANHVTVLPSDNQPTYDQDLDEKAPLSGNIGHITGKNGEEEAKKMRR